MIRSCSGCSPQSLSSACRRLRLNEHDQWNTLHASKTWVAFVSAMDAGNAQAFYACCSSSAKAGAGGSAGDASTLMSRWKFPCSHLSRSAKQRCRNQRERRPGTIKFTFPARLAIREASSWSMRRQVEAGSEFRDQADERRLTVVRFAPEEAKQTASNIRTWPEALSR